MTIREKLDAILAEIDINLARVKLLREEHKMLIKKKNLYDLGVKYHKAMVKSLDNGMNSPIIVKAEKQILAKKEKDLDSTIEEIQEVNRKLTELNTRRNVLLRERKEYEKQLGSIRNENRMYEAQMRRIGAKKQKQKQRAEEEESFERLKKLYKETKGA